jgi:hypothetical protein
MRSVIDALPVTHDRADSVDVTYPGTQPGDQYSVLVGFVVRNEGAGPAPTASVRDLRIACRNPDAGARSSDLAELTGTSTATLQRRVTLRRCP